MSEDKTYIRRSKHDKENPYMMLVRSTAQNKKLSYEALGLLTYVLSKPDDWHVEIHDLEREHCGRDKARNILKELMQKGYACREKQSRNTVTGQFEWGDYEVAEHPIFLQPDTEKPYTVPFTEEPLTVLPDTVNPIQHSIDLLSNDNERTLASVEEEIQNSSHPVLGDESDDEEVVQYKAETPPVRVLRGVPPKTWGDTKTPMGDESPYEVVDISPRAAPKVTHQSAQVKARNHSGKKSSLSRTSSFKKSSKTAQNNATEAPTRRSTLPAPTQPRIIEKTKTAPVLAVSTPSLDTLIESLAKYPIDATGEAYLSKPISDSGKTARQLYEINPAYKEWFDKVVVVNYSTWALSAKKKMRSDTLAERATLWDEFIQWVHDNDKQVVRDRSACEAEEDEFLKGRASMTNQQIAEGLTAIRKKHGFE